MPKRMTCQTAEADNGAGMLNRVVGVQQLGADRSNLGSDGLRHHLSQPIGVNNLNIVIDKTDDVVLGMVGREIVNSRKIELAGKREDANGFKFVQPSKVRVGLRELAVVIDNNDF